jgi:hypothetical protein
LRIVELLQTFHIALSESMRRASQTSGEKYWGKRDKQSDQASMVMISARPLPARQ